MSTNPGLGEASRGKPSSWWRTLVVVAVTAGVGAVTAVTLARNAGDRSMPTTGVSSSADDAGIGSGVPACSGGPDAALAVVATLTTPDTAEGAAETAAAVVRWTESKSFSLETASEVVRQVADNSGSPELAELQQGQAPYLARMSVSQPRPSDGLFRVMSESGATVVTVLLPVTWSTGEAVHDEWRAIDVRLNRLSDRWAVVSAGSSNGLPDPVRALQGKTVTGQDLSMYGAALTANAFRRYADDC
ncbi:hypothetical protein [Micromonospora sp. NPDC048063]|uniref:hypothetical protein n=1 Tax=Micromonospora sp. NPDC048063 TaxID=3364256 RepID=UPI003710859D